MQDEIPKPGSTISLISSAQVRYEGILEIIQMGPDESSITLANVAQYGTENRPAAEYVPPSTVRFDSVCFKGSDIISLDVKEYYREPPKQPEAVAYNHPDASQQYRQPPAPPSSASVWGPPTGQQPGSSSWDASASTQQPLPAQFAQPSAPPAPANPSSWQGAAPAPTVVVTPSMAARPQAQQPRPPAPRQSGWSNNAANATAGPKRPPNNLPTQGPAAATASGPAGSAQPIAAATATPVKANTGPPPGFAGPPPGIKSGAQQQSHAAPLANGSTDTAPARNEGRGEGGRGRGRGRRGGRGDRHHGGRDSRHQQAPPVPVPNEDFNFQESLSKFDKGKIKDEADLGDLVEDAAPAGRAYNPQDDFFDALSSNLSALSTQERPQRVPFSEQRKVDMETFGGSGVARRPMRGRGRGRRGGRGRGRGGRDPSRSVAVAT